MNTQDWNQVVVTKSSSQKKNSATANASILAANKARGLVTTERRTSGSNTSTHTNTNHQLLAKVDQTDDIIKVPTVNRSLSQAIAQARQAKKMTQAQLATAINERPQIISEYESGKAIPNNQLIAKIERALGTRLPRNK